MVKRILVISFLLMFGFNLHAQDPSYSQFYANPLFLNPALTGSTDCGRINLNYRNQWPSLGNSFVTYNFSYDQYIESISSGIGLRATSDALGDGALINNEIGAFYSYKLNVTSSLVISAGFQASYFMQKLNWDQLIFGDMINPLDPGTLGPTMETPPENLTKNYVDFSAGMAFGLEDIAFGGIAVHHLTKPSISFYSNSDSYLPTKITLHGGVNYDISRGMFGNLEMYDLILSPNILYQQQGEFHQLNIGFYLNRHPIIGGIWFRHNFENADAAIVLIGLQKNNYRIGYSYDFSFSKVGINSGGAHEISFAWEFCVYYGKSKRRKIKAIKSPLF